jgi:sulfur carrier protein ThiS adenylyltransferase
VNYRILIINKQEKVSYLSEGFNLVKNSEMRYSEIKAHLSKFRIGIAGAGGLGSNCAVALARSGVGTLVIADYDIIEEANLNRQYYFIDQIGVKKTIALKENISKINPAVSVIIHHAKIDRSNIVDFFSGCNIIVEAFDSAEMKEMLIETVQQKMPGIPLVVGSGMAGWGKNNDITCRKIDNTLYVVGDECSEVSDDLPPIAPRVGVVANMQANIVLELLMNIE